MCDETKRETHRCQEALGCCWSAVNTVFGAVHGKHVGRELMYDDGGPMMCGGVSTWTDPRSNTSSHRDNWRMWELSASSWSSSNLDSPRCPLSTGGPKPLTGSIVGESPSCLQSSKSPKLLPSDSSDDLQRGGRLLQLDDARDNVPGTPCSPGRLPCLPAIPTCLACVGGGGMGPNRAAKSTHYGTVRGVSGRCGERKQRRRGYGAERWG